MGLTVALVTPTAPRRASSNCRTASVSPSAIPNILKMAVSVLFSFTLEDWASVETICASNPLSSILLKDSSQQRVKASFPHKTHISATCSGETTLKSCTATALSVIKLTVKLTIPSTPSNAPVMAAVQAPQVIPPTATVVVAIFDTATSTCDVFFSSRTSESTISASNPESSILDSAACQRLSAAMLELGVGSGEGRTFPLPPRPTTLRDRVQSPHAPSSSSP